MEAIQIKIVEKYKREYYGIDVADYQGVIDFDKLANSGKVDFMIAQAGWYSESRQKFMPEDYFERNYEEAKKRNIPLGTYIYSYATNVEEAKHEEEELVNYLKSIGKTEFELPIFYDVEDEKYQGKLSVQTRTDMVLAFGEIIKNAGYKVGLYSNMNRIIY